MTAFDDFVARAKTGGSAVRAAIEEISATMKPITPQDDKRIWRELAEAKARYEASICHGEV